jgi:hypothetical protein
MIRIDSVEALLNDLGALTKVDYEKRRLREIEEAPYFDALSFFKSNEVIATEILAYLITPSAKHGASESFIRALLEVLGIPVSEQPLKSVVVLHDSVCFTLKERKRMDILIRFRDLEEYAIIIESKSHGAVDQPGQIDGYLRHLKSAYPNSRKYLFYLNDGQAPNPNSIATEDWEHGVADGTCHPKEYESIITSWIDACLAKSRPQKLRDFLQSFRKFVGITEESTVKVSKEIEGMIAQIIQSGSSQGEEISPELDALVELSTMADFVWRTSLGLCLKKVETELGKQLPGWEYGRCSYPTNKSAWPLNEFELDLWKSEWKEPPKEEPMVCVSLATWFEETTTSFSLVWSKRKDLPSPPDLKFDDKGRFYLTRAQYTHPASHIADLRSSEGIRYLLTEQAAMDLVNDIMQFISDHESKMEDTVEAKLKSVSSPQKLPLRQAGRKRVLGSKGKSTKKQ